MPLFGIKFPWETEEGEGFIAPWTEASQGPGGDWTQNKYSGGAPPGVTMPYKSDMPMKEAGLLGGIGSLAGAAAPIIGGVLGGAGLGGILSGILGGDDEAGEPVGEGGGLKFPWQTASGEGFIAPWSPQISTPEGWAQPGTSQAIAGFVPGEGMAGIAKTWNTGTAQFALLTDGKMMVLRKNGTVKTWRPKKHIVISSNPRMSAIGKLDRAHKRVQKQLRKYQPRKVTYGVPPSRLLSAAEKKLIREG